MNTLIQSVINAWVKDGEKRGGVFFVRTEEAYCIGGAWAIDSENFKLNHVDGHIPTIKKNIRENGWSKDHPMSVAISRNNMCFVENGNHRLLMAVEYRVEMVCVEFKYYEASNWPYNDSCYPRLSCQECSVCRNTLPEFRYPFDRVAGLNSYESLVRGENNGLV